MQLRATRLGAIGNRRPPALTISQLLPSGAGRVAAIYSDPARPSYDECIAKNMAAIASGRPQDCVLFADAAGQTPVVYPIGAGQGKGLLLDRSAGLVRGVELVADGSFDAGVTALPYVTRGAVDHSAGSAVLTTTSTVGATGVTVALVDPLVTTAGLYEVSISVLSRSVGNSGHRLLVAASTAQNSGLSTTSRFYASAVGEYSGLLWMNAGDTVTVTAVDGTATIGDAFTLGGISVREIPGNHQQQPTAAARGEFSRRYNQLLATATLSTQSITAIATQYRLFFTGAGTVTLSGAATGAYSAGSHTITCTAGSLTLTVAGEVLTADLRLEADATIGLPEYQRVTTASDYDEVGFQTYWRAVTDDWAKSHMNPAGATKAYVFWAGQKMSDAAAAIVVEHGNAGAINGSMYLAAPALAGQPQYGVASRGTTGVIVQDTDGVNAAPSRSVVVTDTGIPNDIAGITVNSRARVNNTGDQGTGTYTEQDVFFGARTGTSVFANIREYAPPTILFLQPADSLSASHLAKLQRAYAKAVGVTL